LKKFIICLLTFVLFVVASPILAQPAPEATIAMPSPATLDPVSLSRFDLHGRDLVENLFIGLTRINARQGQVEPDLAASWTVSDDGLRWRFALRDDVQWVMMNAAGELEALRPVVAGDVVFAAQRACDPTRPSPPNTNLYIIAGCRTLARSPMSEQMPLDIVGVRALDDHTLEIELLFPAGYFLTITSLPELRPLPSEYVNDSVASFPRPGLAVTSGRWAVESWTAGGALRLVRNPFWVGEIEGNLAAVNVRFDLDVTAFDAGAVDLLRVDSGFVDGQQDAAVLRANDAGTLIFLGFSFNNVDADDAPLPSPLDLPDVRRALALALDRDGLAQIAFGNSAKGSGHFTPRTAIAAPSSPAATFDPTAAQQTLARAGYPNCTGLGQLPIAVSSDPQELLLVQNMVVQWQANLGCSLETFPIVQTTRTAILDSAHKTVDVSEAAPFPLWLLTWSADYPDAQAWITDALHCDYGYFRVGRLCDRIDAVMDQAALAQDITSRFTSYNQIETDLFGALGGFPVVPLAISRQWWLQQPWLSGVGGYGTFQFDRWVIEK